MQGPLIHRVHRRRWLISRLIRPVSCMALDPLADPSFIRSIRVPVRRRLSAARVSLPPPAVVWRLALPASSTARQRRRASEPTIHQRARTRISPTPRNRLELAPTPHWILTAAHYMD